MFLITFILRAEAGMKKTRIAILKDQNNLPGLVPLLSLVGLSGEVFSSPQNLLESVRQSPPDLVLKERDLVDDETSGDGIETLSEKISPFCPVLFVEEKEDRFLFVDLERNQVFQPFDLFEYLQLHLQLYSRKKLRVAVKLPSVIFFGGRSEFTQISCLSTGGAFIKTGHPTPEKGEILEMTIPLLGHRAEIELCGRVAYNVLPSLENNYIQGVGICFEQPDGSSAKKIKDYLYAYLNNSVPLDYASSETQRSWHLEPVKQKPSSRGIQLKSFGYR
jgi:hypothetical protein